MAEVLQLREAVALLVQVRMVRTTTDAFGRGAVEMPIKLWVSSEAATAGR